MPGTAFIRYPIERRINQLTRVNKCRFGRFCIAGVGRIASIYSRLGRGRYDQDGAGGDTMRRFSAWNTPEFRANNRSRKVVLGVLGHVRRRLHPIFFRLRFENVIPPVYHYVMQAHPCNPVIP